MIGKTLSEQFHADTEKPGQSFDEATHAVIFDRYHFSGEFVKNKRVLEVGVGAGLGVEYLSGLASSYHGIELSSENLKILEEQGISLDQISEGDAHSIPFKGGSFDVVLALAMIYYLSLDRFLGEAYRCLSDNGVLFFCTSNKDVPGFCAAPGTTKYYSIPELYIVLTSHGYSVTFYGAFSCVGGTESLGKRKFLATLKGVLKTMFESTNIGRCIWKGLREAWLGRKIPLPEKITDSNIGSVSHILLDPSKRDQTHRVIYVVAEKK